jgi:hypothetical protein
VSIRFFKIGTYIADPSIIMLFASKNWGEQNLALTPLD